MGGGIRRRNLAREGRQTWAPASVASAPPRRPRSAQTRAPLTPRTSFPNLGILNHPPGPLSETFPAPRGTPSERHSDASVCVAFIKHAAHAHATRTVF